MRYQLFHDGLESALRIATVGDFVIGDREIRYRSAPDAWEGAIGRYLLTFVLCHWLERRGLPVLHGACIDVDGRAVVLLGGGGTGKSTLAATFASVGYRLLSDDFVPLRVETEGIHALPSYPLIGLWPDAAVPDGVVQTEGAVAVHPSVNKWMMAATDGTFCTQALPVGLVCSLCRTESAPPPAEAEVTRLAGSPAVMECLRQSIAPRTAAAAGLSATRLGVFSRLANEVPVVRLEYGSDRSQVEALRDRILALAIPQTLSEP